MKIIIESINFEPSSLLNKFIKEKALAFIQLNRGVLFSEFNLSAIANNFNCTIILNLSGKEIVFTKTANSMDLAVSKAIAAVKQSIKEQIKHQ